MGLEGAPEIAAGLALGWHAEHMRDRACPGGSGLSVPARPLSFRRPLLSGETTGTDAPRVLRGTPPHQPLPVASEGQMCAGCSFGADPCPPGSPRDTGPKGTVDLLTEGLSDSLIYCKIFQRLHFTLGGWVGVSSKQRTPPGTLGSLEKIPSGPSLGWLASPFPLCMHLKPGSGLGFSLDFSHDLGPGSEPSGPQLFHLYMGSIGKVSGEMCPLPLPVQGPRLQIPFWGGPLTTFPPAIGCPG